MSEIVSGLTGQLTGVSQFAEHLGKYAPPTLHKYLYNNKHQYKHEYEHKSSATSEVSQFAEHLGKYASPAVSLCTVAGCTGMHQAAEGWRCALSKIWKTLRRTWWMARCTSWSVRCTCRRARCTWWSVGCTCWRARCSAWVQPMGLACEVQGRAGQRGEEEKEQQLLSWENYHMSSYRYNYSLAQKQTVIKHL